MTDKTILTGSQDSPLSTWVDSRWRRDEIQGGVRPAYGIRHCASFCAPQLQCQDSEPQLQLVDFGKWRDRQIRLPRRSTWFKEQ